MLPILIKLVLLSIYLMIVQKVNCTPALLWGFNCSSKPSLTIINQNTFTDLMMPLTEQYMFVVFMEKNLTTNDFQCKNKDSNRSCYNHLQNVNPKCYYANVENPMNTFNIMTSSIISNTINHTGHLQMAITCRKGAINVVNFIENNNLERAKLLENHDYLISSISQNMTMLHCPIVYVYTTMDTVNLAARKHRKRRRHRRRSRRHDVKTTTMGNIFTDPNFSIYFKQLLLRRKSNDTALEINSMTVTGDETKISISLSTNESKSLKFSLDTMYDYYVIKFFEYDDITYHATDVETPVKFSYYCGYLQIRGKDGSSLIWKRLQFQGSDNEIDVNEFRFAEAWHCVGFFTSAIASGLLVLMLMGAIIYCGITWIMDIGAGDRFEDPNAHAFVTRSND